MINRANAIEIWLKKTGLVALKVSFLQQNRLNQNKTAFWIDFYLHTRFMLRPMTAIEHLEIIYDN